MIDFSVENNNPLSNRPRPRISYRLSRPVVNRNRIDKTRIADKIENAKVIKKLDQTETKKLSSINFKDSIADCLTCYRNIPNEQLITSCPQCINFYHRAHLKKWLRRNPFCPNCRKRIDVKILYGDEKQ